jgi:hypothetical protein
MTMTPLTPVYRDWEEHFTVAQWDRRGTGRTLRRNGKEGDRLTFNEAESNQPGSRRGVAAYALDPDAAALLWQVSLDMLAA